MNKIEAKKQELEQNLHRIQKGLDQSLQEVKEDVSQSVTPTQVVKKFPLPVVGGALLLGLLVGTSGRKRVKKESTSTNTIIDSISSSVKKKLTQKVTDAAMNYLEQKLSSRGSENES